MGVTHGFQLLREQKIQELNIQARLFRHLKTGAELLSLSNDDENKVFGITFRTPPSDSTGVAHILEHSVLCGSRKYPVKEPFVELLKGSLQTFLNAFTYPDKTCYPVASQNAQDFYNLIDVYLDAVFYPRLTPQIFQQEGWHYELEKPEDPLAYKGVVFNEMKGAYSSPDNLLSEYSLQALFPDNAYGLDSGGHPKEIPNLTYKRFQAFHKKFYHPSNARLYFYGDDDPERRLQLADGYLSEFDRLEVDSAVPLQPPFPEPRQTVRPYMAGEEGREEGPKAMVTVNWVLAQSEAVEINFALRILEYVLLGMPGSPLRKALIDSGLGEDVAGGGLGTELRQSYFSTGLKGVRLENKERVEQLVLNALAKLADDGIDPLTTEAAFNTIEFLFRENNTGHFPRGLLLMLRSLSTWLYDGDPLALLAFERPIETLKARLHREPKFFEGMIKQAFLENPHRATLFLEPDGRLREKEENDERRRLDQARADMNPDEEQKALAETRALKERQEKPDPPEALATIPSLALEDLDRKNKTIPIRVLRHKETEILFHDLSTNGIAYLDLGFNLHLLPDKFLPYVPLLGRSFVEMGTEREDYVLLTQRISRKTGGIGSEAFASSSKLGKSCAAWLFLRGKAMISQVEELTSILRDVLLTVRLDNRERFRQMLLEEKARCEQRLVPSGHQMVNLRIKSHFGEAYWASEQMGGISYLFFLRELTKRVEEDWAEVSTALEEMRRILVNAEAMTVNVTLDQTDWGRFEPHLQGLLDALPRAQRRLVDWHPSALPLNEGMEIPSQVNYVGKGANLYDLGYRFNGSALVISRYLRNAWLWDRIRVQGGAYGAFCLFDRLSGTFSLVSYRDPNLMRTLEEFDKIPQFLGGLDLGREELTKAVIGTIGDLDAHLLPDAKGYASMVRRLTGDSDEDRQKMREEVLQTKAEDFRAMAPVLDEAKRAGIVKVLGSPSAIEGAAEGRPGWLEVFRVL